MTIHTIEYPRYTVCLDTIIADLAEIPDEATCLDLRCDLLLGELDQKDFDLIFRCMPENITEFRLTDLQLGTRTESLSPLLVSLAHARNINTLNLMQNDLFLKEIPELSDSFSMIPTNIQTLNLELNDFGSCTIKEITALLKALPNHIVELTMSYREICFYGKVPRTIEELRLIGEALPHLLQFNLINAEGCEISDNNAGIMTIRQSMGHWFKKVPAFCYAALNINPEAPLLPRSMIIEILSFLTEPPFELNLQVTTPNYFNQAVLLPDSTANESKSSCTVIHI